MKCIYFALFFCINNKIAFFTWF